MEPTEQPQPDASTDEKANSTEAPGLSAEEPAPKPEKPQKADAKSKPLGKIGEDVPYIAGNGHVYPAKVTHVDEDTGTVALAVFYKGHLDFIGDVSSKQQEDAAQAKRDKGETLAFGPPRSE